MWILSPDRLRPTFLSDETVFFYSFKFLCSQLQLIIQKPSLRTWTTVRCSRSFGCGWSTAPSHQQRWPPPYRYWGRPRSRWRAGWAPWTLGHESLRTSWWSRRWPRRARRSAPGRRRTRRWCWSLGRQKTEYRSKVCSWELLLCCQHCTIIPFSVPTAVCEGIVLMLMACSYTAIDILSAVTCTVHLRCLAYIVCAVRQYQALT